MPGDFICIFWLGLVIVSYLQSVLDVINSVVQIPIDLKPKFSLLGFVELAHTMALRTSKFSPILCLKGHYIMLEKVLSFHSPFVDEVG